MLSNFVTHGWVREARVLKLYQFIGQPYCVTSWVSFHNSNLPRVGFGENLQAYYYIAKEF
jgi:hypothetical protein